MSPFHLIEKVTVSTPALKKASVNRMDVIGRLAIPAGITDPPQNHRVFPFHELPWVVPMAVRASDMIVYRAVAFED